MKKKKQDTKEKQGKTLKILIISTIAVVALVILSIIFFSGPSERDIISIDEASRLESLEKSIQEKYQPDRVEYGYGKINGKSFLIEDSFNNLPLLPEDFFKYKYSIMSGKATSTGLCDLEYDYYAQPEYYGSTWVDSGLPRYQIPDTTHWTPEGYGTFPHELQIVSTPGETLELCTFFHSAFGVQTYQGFKLKSVHPSNVQFNGETYIIDKEISREYLRLNISNPDILLEPTYLKFGPGWTVKVVTTLTISEESKPGMYAIAFDAYRAEPSNSLKWSLEYLENYRDIGNIRVNEEQFIISVKVVDEI